MADVRRRRHPHTEHEFDHSEHHTSTGLSNNKLAFWLFLGSECLLFGGLISTYFLYRGRIGDGPGVQDESTTSRSPRSARSCC